LCRSSMGEGKEGADCPRSSKVHSLYVFGGENTHVSIRLKGGYYVGPNCDHQGNQETTASS